MSLCSRVSSRCFRWLATACVLGAAASAFALPNESATAYALTADSQLQADVPQGQLEGPFEFHSRIYAGTVRRYWIFVPAQYESTHPASLLVFQDGQRATNSQGSLRIPTVLDNLIHRGDIPVTIGVFITPGNVSERYRRLGHGQSGSSRREYMRRRSLRAHADDELRRACASASPSPRSEQQRSAVLAAARRAFTSRGSPDVFRKVISLIGSYTSIGYRPAHDDTPMTPGGDLYPTLIRKSAIRPLRIYLQDGTKDLDNEHGHWFLANQQMLAALNWANANADREQRPGARYDVAHTWGAGGIRTKRRRVLPTPAWLWRDESARS